MTNVLIIGGGFGGVACALALAKQKNPNITITLVSDTPHFEYHGALYRLVAGGSPFEVCIPLWQIFEGLDVNICQDKILSVDTEKKTALGESEATYAYDYVVIGVGCRTCYYDTPGLEKYSFSMKSIREALVLKRHLHGIYDSCAATTVKEEQVCKAHIVVVGGGPSGVELAGELAVYGKKLALAHGADPSMTTIDLIHSPSRLLPGLKEAVSAKIEERLRSLGVNVFLNRRVIKEDIDTVYLQDMKMKAKTLVWTAGVASHPLLDTMSKISRDNKGRVAVNKYLQSQDDATIFAVGDVAGTEFSGMAQTALTHGKLVGENVLRMIAGEKKVALTELSPIYAIPVGPGWAAVQWGDRVFYGGVGWFLRRYLDWKVFTSLLPVHKAIIAWMSSGKLTESCPVCLQGEQETT